MTKDQTSFQHLMQNKLNTKYFIWDKLRYIHGYAYMNKLGNQSIVEKLLLRKVKEWLLMDEWA